MKISMSLLVNEELIDFCLHGKQENETVHWRNVEPGQETATLEIITDDLMRNIIHEPIIKNIQTREDDIKELFLSALLAAEFVQRTDEADGFEHTHDTHEMLTKEDNPYDPKRIRIETGPLPIVYICDLIKDGKIDMAPDFQREFVWTEITRKSRLIESIMLRIPLPVFYFAKNMDGKFQVVDGIQRLTVINDYVNNKFKLKNLEYLKELEGKWFKNGKKEDHENLPELYFDRIKQTQLLINTIDPQTPPQVKYDIFRRLNTGGKALNAQEVRNCLSSPMTRALLSEMVNLASFLQATRGSIRKTRMADRDMAMRFVGFYLLDNDKATIKYKNNMDEFLDLITVFLNENLDKNLYNAIVSDFDRAMQNAYTLFGGYAFRKVALINKALFLSWSRILYKFENEKLISLNDEVNTQLTTAIHADYSYNYAISASTNHTDNISIAYDKANEIMEGLLT